MSAQECHEEVTRKGHLEPCERTAVAIRYDPNEGGIYPVCIKHVRKPMRPMQQYEWRRYQAEERA